jgi:UDP-N-acetyl-D-mannosaminuronic acid dehydrogenase
LKKELNTYKKISIVGLGYIGLPTAIVVAEQGYHVAGFDIDEKRIEQIKNGVTPIKEPEVSERLQGVLKSGCLQVYSELQKSDCYFIAVPTPFKEGKKANLTALFDAGTQIARLLEKDTLVIVESTVPVGTAQRFAHLLEGVIGGVCPRAAERAKEFYASFVKGSLYVTDDKTAEMVKLVENSSRDIQIAFANQIAAMCEQADIDPFKVIKLANKHPRVNILYPGCGVGGHCIAVDPWFLIETFPHATVLLKTARTINDAKPYQVVEKALELVQQFKQTHNKKRRPSILVLGLTFKPDVDDLRQSPAFRVAQELVQKKSIFDLFVCEPNVSTEHIASLGFDHITDLWQGLARADIVIALVKHSVFEELTPTELYGKQVLDTCGLLHVIKGKHKMEQSSTIVSEKTVGGA